MLQALTSFWEAITWKKGGEVALRSGAETGRVFFVDGRIAWAAASTVKRTFLGYLVQHSELSRPQLQEVFEACRSSGGNFGETLVEWGLLDEEQLRSLLLSHLAECVLEILCWPHLSSMFVPEDRAYKGSLTFELHEVLQRVLDLDTEGRLPVAGLTAHAIIERLEQGPSSAVPHASPWSGPAADLAGPTVESTSRAVGADDRAAGSTRSRLWMIAVASILTVAAAAGGLYALWPRSPPEATAPHGAAIARHAQGTEPAADGGAATRVGATTPRIGARAGDSSAEASMRAGADAAPLDGSAHAPAATAAVEPAPPAAGEQQPPHGVVVGLAGQGTGSVKVVSVPGRARIYLDGIDTGRRTPYRMRKVAGGIEHVIMLQRPGFRLVHKRFKLAPGMEATLRFALSREPRRTRRRTTQIEPQQIHVLTEPPGARIYVDRRDSGLSTPANVSLDPRRTALVELRVAGYRPWRRRIRPVAEVALSYRVQLQALRRKPRRRRTRPLRRKRR